MASKASRIRSVPVLCHNWDFVPVASAAGRSQAILYKVEQDLKLVTKFYFLIEVLEVYSHGDK